MTGMAGVIKLTRWREHLGFVIPLTLLGFLLARQITFVKIDFKILMLLVANILAVSYAFMINDIEDAQDDLNLDSKVIRNPVSNNTLTKRFAYFSSYVTASLALVIYFMLGGNIFLPGLILILLAYFY